MNCNGIAGSFEQRMFGTIKGQVYIRPVDESQRRPVGIQSGLRTAHVFPTYADGDLAWPMGPPRSYRRKAGKPAVACIGAGQCRADLEGATVSALRLRCRPTVEPARLAGDRMDEVHRRLDEVGWHLLNLGTDPGPMGD